MAKVTLKDLNYTAYELGIDQGKELLKQFSSSGRNDPLGLLEELWPDRTLDEFEETVVEDGTIEEVTEVAKNFFDGIEDGVRSGVYQWLVKYKKSFD